MVYEIRVELYIENKGYDYKTIISTLPVENRLDKMKSVSTIDDILFMWFFLF